MRCHYEVLDVARDADASAIRKAYHRMALLWHPDKSKAPDAEERFREVQAAYEILSVPNERAWCARAAAARRGPRAALDDARHGARRYDGHRESILRDGAAAARAAATAA